MIKEVVGDLWEYPADAVCITTNGVVKRDGTLVMGLGVAAQARDRYPELPLMLGTDVKRFGNVLLAYGMPDRLLVSFPVKNHWREPADLELIKLSAEKLAGFATGLSDKIFVLPRPGCGAGNRDWETEVKPIIGSLLPDNVHVISLK